MALHPTGQCTNTPPIIAGTCRLQLISVCGEPEDLHRGRLTFERIRSPVGESGRSGNQGVDGLLGQKDRVAGGLGELLNTGSDVDGVTDQGELQLASAADGSGDHLAGVDSDADPKL